MKFFFCIISSISFFFCVRGADIIQIKERETEIQIQDTIIEDVVKEDSIIEQIIETKKTPEKDKVQYVSQLTRYGFKNLFNKFGYNSSLPYSSQVNPHAEGYMQSYLKSHSNSLIRMKSWEFPILTSLIIFSLNTDCRGN